MYNFLLAILLICLFNTIWAQNRTYWHKEPEKIRIGEYEINSTTETVRRLKAILDKLELPHILDDVSFHNTLLDLYRVKYIYKTDVWKVEKDGSVSLKNRFGHSGRFEYRCLTIRNLLEFHFVDLSLLNREEAEFLSAQIYEFEFRFNLSANTG